MPGNQAGFDCGPEDDGDGDGSYYSEYDVEDDREEADNEIDIK